MTTDEPAGTRPWDGPPSPPMSPPPTPAKPATAAQSQAEPPRPATSGTTATQGGQATIGTGAKRDTPPVAKAAKPGEAAKPAEPAKAAAPAKTAAPAKAAAAAEAKPVKSAKPAKAEQPRVRAPRRPRGRSGVFALLAGLGLFVAGGATGWWASDQFGPRYAPDVNVTVASGPAVGGNPNAMPDVRGLSESEAREVIADSGLADAKIKTKDQPSIAAKGTVIAQEPAAGADRTGTVTLTLASPAEIPPVVGADVRAGVRDLQELGATVEVRRTYQAGAAVDTVLAVDPPVGKPVPAHVILTVAAPPAIAYLGDLPGTQGGCSAQAVSVNGVRYEHALRCAADVGRFTEAAYLLDRKTLRFDAVIGQPDTDATGRTVQYAVVGDGKVMVSGVLRYGETRTLSLDTSGVLRLVLRVTAGSNTAGAAVASVAFGDARVTAGPADIAAVRTATP